MLAARPPEERPFTAIRRALGSFGDLYTAQADRVTAAKRLAHETPAIRARLLDKHARWENGVAEELAARLGVDPDDDPRPRLIAAVALAAFSTAVTRWVDSNGREDLPALLHGALEAVATGLDQRPARTA
jgi:MftR C-terminal domain